MTKCPYGNDASRHHGKAHDHGVEMVVVAHHSKNWWVEALAGSVTKYLIDRSKLNVVVLH
jgi:nucleotide-binding universal stress UspA family protein